MISETTSTASSSASRCASCASTAGSSSRSVGAAPTPPAASWRICSIWPLSISFSRRFWSSVFSRATQRRRKAEMSEKPSDGSLATDSDSATIDPKVTSLATRCALVSGSTVRYMKASTAQRWTEGLTLASRRPRVAVSSLPVGLMSTRWVWCSRQVLASATHARQRTRGFGDLSIALRLRMGSSPAFSRKCCGSLAAWA
mmetsp:Transcript_24344/g.62182  ORF Transcript_24344/g.62182 Transcript_24344/m.62182 type:complete len:200 (+) Transcript_24344:1186-1785(+)